MFQGCERRLIQSAVLDLELAMIEPGQTVYSTGDVADYMVWLHGCFAHSAPVHIYPTQMCAIVA